MKKCLLIAGLLMMALGAPPADARGHGGVSLYANFGCCGGYYGGYYPYPAYYYPYAVAPPPVVYAVPPAPVVYAEPAPPLYMEEPVYVASPAIAANQTSPTFIDHSGRTCRHYEATSPGGAPYGTACLQPDGTWHAVP